MKKFFAILSVLFLVGTVTVSAQKMRKGLGICNIGVGFVPGIGANVSYDYGLVDTWGPGIFTVGGYIGFENNSHNKSLDIRATRWGFSPRATYRYAINESFEVYGTAMLGALFISYSKLNDNSGGPFFATTAGCRYTFAGNISVFAEAGFNELSFLNGGLSIAF